MCSLKDYKITVGMDIASNTVTVNRTNVTLSVHDVAGQARFDTVRTVFFKGAHLVLLVFDLTRRETLTVLRTQWIQPIVETNPGASIHSILIGNKADLDDLRAFDHEDGEKWISLVKKIYPGMIIHGYIETSALQNKNVDKAFTDLVKAYLQAN